MKMVFSKDNVDVKELRQQSVGHRNPRATIRGYRYLLKNVSFTLFW